MNKKLIVGILCLFLPTTHALADKPKNVSIMDLEGTRIHTFHGVSNSHIIETGSSLFLIDAQMKIKHAEKLKLYIKSLKKPLNQIVLSHNHPDHWFGAERLEDLAPITTSKNVKNDLKTGGGRYLKLMKKKMKGHLPKSVIVPSKTLALGQQNWDSLGVIVEEYAEQESHHSLVIKIPSLGVLIAQDMVYNNLFLVASERSRNAQWIEFLRQFKEKDSADYPHVLVGHGKNAGPELYQQNIDYLIALDNILEKGLTQKETTEALIKQFPSRGGKQMLAISMRNLFKGH